jgi:alpha/beta superfamily hydrolase
VVWLAVRVCVCLDYRGYGQSDGKPNREGIQEDAVAAVRWVRESPDVDPDRLIVFGQSLGAAIASMSRRAEQGAPGVVLKAGFRAIARLPEQAGGELSPAV